jgi:DNA-directed RNA polymerase specialized sigma24 family protein
VRPSEPAQIYGSHFARAGLLYWEHGLFYRGMVGEPNTSLVERLFSENRSKLQSFFRRRIRSSADAPDLVQEVYLRMLRISDKEAIRNPLFYLYTVANNLVKEHAALEHRQAAGIDI